MMDYRYESPYSAGKASLDIENRSHQQLSSLSFFLELTSPDSFRCVRLYNCNINKRTADNITNMTSGGVSSVL